MKRRFKATVVVRRFAWVHFRGGVKRKVSKELGLTFGKYYVEANPTFRKLLAKCTQAVKREGATLDVVFRKPNSNDKGYFAVEVADIILTWPD